MRYFTPPAERRRVIYYRYIYLDSERFAATAFILNIWIIELKAFVQSFAHKIQLRTIDVRQAFRIDQ